MRASSILVINTGSSTLKFGVYQPSETGETLLLEGFADGVGTENGVLQLQNAAKQVLRSDPQPFATQREALCEVLSWFKELHIQAPSAIGHRVVHGGPRLVEHQRITPEVLINLRDSVHFAPLHIPVALTLIDSVGLAFPGTPQFACFDTAFHRTLPESASRLPLPRELFDEGIRRYGFHGLSYESVLYQLGGNVPKRVVLAHLGSGASLAAVKNGSSIDTTMGMTPTGGIPMASRCGDIDPGVLLYLLRSKKADADALEAMLNHDAGLKALSGGTSDMRLLISASQDGDAKSALAFEAFCSSVAKTIGAYAAVLGGIDLIVFTGGIGEHSAPVRKRVCERLEFLGARLSSAANEANEPVISTSESCVAVAVRNSQEDVQIARHCRVMLRDTSGRTSSMCDRHHRP